jgi:hypothetical protein
LLLKKPFAVPWASALRHAELPACFEAARLELVTRRSDGNREFVRLLELCVTHSIEAVEAALEQARRQGGWSADTVHHLLTFETCQQTPTPPLDPSAYPAYQTTHLPPDLLAYNRLLEVRS